MPSAYKRNILIIVGIILFIAGIVLAVIYQHPHFYASFSLGLFILLLISYNSISKEKIFSDWRWKKFLVYFVIMLISVIAIDQIGILLGYWAYPQFNTLSDEIVKYLFEYVVPFLYLMLFFMIGIRIFEKINLNYKLSFFLSLIVFSTLIGLFTEYINSFANSWQVLSMPISNFQVNSFFLVWQTIGYWLMALVPFAIYKFVDKTV